jgi:hypothetical protein
LNDSDLHARASEIFVALRSLVPSEREAALAEAGGTDPRLRAEVESLLEHDVRDRTFGLAADLSEATEEANARIGPYQLVRRIGRGSSGQVFLAE